MRDGKKLEYHINESGKFVSAVGPDKTSKDLASLAVFTLVSV